VIGTAGEREYRKDQHEVVDRAFQAGFLPPRRVSEAGSRLSTTTESSLWIREGFVSVVVGLKREKNGGEATLRGQFENEALDSHIDADVRSKLPAYIQADTPVFMRPNGSSVPNAFHPERVLTAGCRLSARDSSPFVPGELCPPRPEGCSHHPERRRSWDCNMNVVPSYREEGGLVVSDTDQALAKRRAERMRRIVTNIAYTYEEAEAWDLEFWQSKSPEDRLNALEELRADWSNIRHADH